MKPSFTPKLHLLRWWLTATLVLAGWPLATQAADFKSGEDSPVHDSDRLVPLSAKQLTLENEALRITFDGESGAITGFIYKKTGWAVQGPAQLGDSFRVFAPTHDRSYNPILGARNRLAAVTRSEDGRTLTLTWKDLVSEYTGKLDITLTGTVRLDGGTVSFDMNVVNHSPNQISSLSWPILGALAPPEKCRQLTRYSTVYSNLAQTSLYPKFENDHGYYGTNYPMQMGEMREGRYSLVTADQRQGLYLGTHDTSQREIVRYMYELKPGYGDSYNSRVPPADAISGHPARISTEAVHFAFVQPGESAPLARVVLSPFQGDWHQGIDVYRAWRATWFRRPATPAWASDVHSWQQIQINSAEDDLRTQYRDLPRRAAEAKTHGVAAIQLVGWNDGGQDRGNPSHNPDPRLGTHDELKQAIAQIEAMGVHVILFNKYVWADVTLPNYEKDLLPHISRDPNGFPNVYHGYRYQTPEQLEDINTRRLAVACTNDPGWLDLCAAEFRKSLELGASGILYDEVCHHGGPSFCFSAEHGHHVPATLWAGDTRLGNLMRKLTRESVGEDRFLIAGEYPYDEEQLSYSLSYFRIEPGFLPEDRYADPFLPIMIAASGFDDREMINRALMYRYIISYEPFNFKGNLSDQPLTVEYGKQVDALRRRYRAYLWDAEFRDNQDAHVNVGDTPYDAFTVFKRTDGRRALVITNVRNEPIAATIAFDEKTPATLAWVSPEDPELHSCGTTVNIPSRSSVVVLQQ